MSKYTENEGVTQDTKRDSCIFYRSFFEAIELLPEQYQLSMFKANFSYSMDFQKPQFDGVESAIWKLIKPQLDANIKRWANGRKGAAHGIKGGRPKKVDKTPEEPLKKPNSTPNVNNNVNPNLFKGNQRFLEDLKENEREHASWAEGMHMQLGIKLGKLPELLKRFCGHLQSSSKEHDDLESFKKHFRNWLFTEDKFKRLEEFKNSKVGAI